MKNLWLLFAQFTTLCVAALLVITVFKPDLLKPRLPPAAPTPDAAPNVTIAPQAAPSGPAVPGPASYRAAAKKAMAGLQDEFGEKTKARMQWIESETNAYYANMGAAEAERIGRRAGKETAGGNAV